MTSINGGETWDASLLHQQFNRASRHAQPYPDRLRKLVDKAEALASKYNRQAEDAWGRNVAGEVSGYDRVQAMADHHDERMERLHAVWLEHPDRTEPHYCDTCRHCGLHHNPAAGGRLHHDGTGFACDPDAPKACDTDPMPAEFLAYYLATSQLGTKDGARRQWEYTNCDGGYTETRRRFHIARGEPTKPKRQA